MSGRLLSAVCALSVACSAPPEEGEPVLIPEGRAYPKLSEWRLFRDLPSLTPRAELIPYGVNSPLFSDYTVKHRFLYVPEGEQITYHPDAAWEFPVGSILVKVFALAEDPQAQRIVETRLLIHTEEGWEPEVYLWNEAQTDAERVVSGELIPLTRAESGAARASFTYSVPTRGECRKCHGAKHPVDGAQPTRALGPTTAQLNRELDYGSGAENQIDHLLSLGMLKGEVEPAEQRVTWPDPQDANAATGDRARAYLASNCAHCHSADGEALDKDLWLDFESTAKGADPYRYGVCKQPTSAGNAECSAELDIVPGEPDASLMVCRLTLLGKGQMSPLGRNLVHAEGVELIRAWIADMALPGCAAKP